LFYFMLMKSITALGLLLVASASLKGQMVWHNADSVFGQLPSSFHVYKTTTQLDGKPNIAYYVSAPLKDKHLDFTTQVGHGQRYTPSQYFEKENKPLVVVNGSFFSFADNRNLNLVIQRGMLQAFNLPVVKMPKDTTTFYYITRSAIGINKHRKADVVWTFTDTAMRYAYALPNGPAVATGKNQDPDWHSIQSSPAGEKPKKIKWKMETAIGGGPTLLQEGQIKITNNEERMFVGGEADRHPRTAMGYTKDGRLIILVIEGRHPGMAEGATLQQEALILQQLGCREALNLDGGGSSCMLINGKQTITPSDKEGQRPVPAVFLIAEH
jgi:hypothetical protein